MVSDNANVSIGSNSPKYFQYKNNLLHVNGVPYSNGKTIKLFGTEYVVYQNNILIAIKYQWMFNNRRNGICQRRRCTIVLS